MTTATAVLGVLALGVMAGFGNADIGRSRALPGLRAEQPAPILVKNKPCKDLDDDDKEDSSALMEGTLSLVLYRVKGWDEDNLSTGKWVGLQSAVPAEKTRARTVEKTQQQATAKSKRAPSSPSVPTAPETAEPAPSKAATDRSASRPSSQAMFEEATRLERSDPARASRLYRRLETGSDSWAQNALYARGRLEASRGNSREARRLLESYLQRFPRGSNVEDARAMLRRLR